MAVQAVLESLGIAYEQIYLGRVKLKEELSAEQYKAVHTGLQKYQLEMLDNKKMIIVERIKNLITEMIYFPDTKPLFKFTVILSEELQYDYTYLSNIFSEVEGGTIERLFILTRIQRVKELMVYENMSLKEISNVLNYSNVSHLCLQFKKITGLKPSEFKVLSKSPEFDWATSE